MTLGLTKPMREVLDFIIAYTAEHGVSPSFQEIADLTGRRGKGNVHRITYALCQRGYIDFLPGCARSITVLALPLVILPPTVQADLDRFCQATGESPADVIADAVRLHLDECALDAAAA